MAGATAAVSRGPCCRYTDLTKQRSQENKDRSGHEQGKSDFSVAYPGPNAKSDLLF